MILPYDAFTEAFLDKVTEYKFCRLPQENRQAIVDGYMKRACAQFSEVCMYNISEGDDVERTYTIGDNATPAEIDEIIDIVTEGMLVQWFKPYFFKQENLENMLATADYTRYSPAELTYRITNAYKTCNKEFVARMREYSYRHGDLTNLYI